MPVLYEKIEDLPLFERCKGGDEAAFEELYKRYFSFLVSSARKYVVSVAVAEDLVQDIFISLYKNRFKIEIEQSLKGYLLRSVRYKILNLHRSAMVQRNMYASLSFSPICENDFANQLDANELSVKIDRLYASLPEKCREVFGLSRNDGLSQKAIANKLHISTSTVEKHVVKALKVFRTALL